MSSPKAETESREELKPFRDVAKEYDSNEKVKEKIIDCIARLDELSQDALKNGDLYKSRRLNDKLISAASIIGIESEDYQSRNEEITAIEHARYIKIIISAFIIILVVFFLIFYRKIKRRYDDIKNNALLRFDRAVDQLAHKITKTADFKDIFGINEIFDYWTNFKAYIVLFTFEREMRNFIRDKLEENFGDTWEKRALSGTKFDDARKRKNQEMSKLPARDFSNVSLIDYCDFPDIDEAIQKNWLLFKSYFRERQYVHVRFESLYSLRKIVAHSRELSKSEFNDVLSNTRWFFDRIAWGYDKPLEME